MTWGKKVCFCLWATCLFLGGIEAGRAADWVVTPSIETRAEYLNNIFYSPRIRQSDYISSAVPKIEFSYNTERTHLEGGLRLVGLHYWQNSNLDRINQYYNITGSTLATSRLKLNLTALYLNTTNSQAAVNVTNVFTTRQRVNVISASPGLTYFLTERWSTDLSYSFRNVDYQSNPFNNFLTHSINSRLNYLYNEKTTFIGSLITSYSQYQRSGNTIMALGPQIGFNRKIKENWDITFLGGANFSQIESTVASTSANNAFGFITMPDLVKQKTSNVNPFINLSTTHHWEKGQINLSYVKSQSPNAYGNQAQYNYFHLNYSQELSERLNLTINPYFNITNFERSHGNYDQYYYGITPSITYKLTEKTLIGATYRFSYRRDTGSQDISYPINNVFVFLRYSYQLHQQ